MAKVRKVFAFEFFNLISRRGFILSLILVPLIPSLIFFVLGKLNQEQTQSLSVILFPKLPTHCRSAWSIKAVWSANIRPG